MVFVVGAVHKLMQHNVVGLDPHSLLFSGQGFFEVEWRSSVGISVLLNDLCYLQHSFVLLFGLVGFPLGVNIQRAKVLRHQLAVGFYTGVMV